MLKALFKNFKDLYNKLSRELSVEYNNLGVIYLTLILAGDIFYLTLSFEPDSKIVYATLIIASLGLICACVIDFKIIRIITSLVFSFILGVTIPKIHYNLKPGVCLDKTRTLKLEGIVTQSGPRSNGTTLYLEQVKAYNSYKGSLEKVNQTEARKNNRSSEQTVGDMLNLYNIKLITKEPHNKFRPGDILKAEAKLFPPSNPLIPQSYNFAEYAYFNSITASGYITGEFNIDRQKSHFIPEFLRGIRAKISKELDKILTEDKKGFAIAILLGESGAIEESRLSQMRISGLSHILAVSGLHLSLAGIIFYSIAIYIFNLSDRLAAKLDIRRLACLFSLFGSSIYLIISGMHISAVRAYIMVGFVITALLFDKWPHSIRSLMAAAVVIILFHPFAVATASFQLSFSAVLGLLSLLNFKTWLTLGGKLEYLERNRFLNYCFSIIASSLVASLISAPFVAYHFNIIPVHSIIANFLAMPVVSILLMPAALITLIFIPLKLAYLVAPVLEFAIGLLQQIAGYVSSIQGAKIFIAYISPESLLLYSFAVITLCVLASKLRFIAVIFIGLFLFKVEYNYQPKMLAINYPKTLVVKGDKCLYIYSYKLPGGFRCNLWGEWMQVESYKFRKIKNIRKLYPQILKKFHLNTEENLKELARVLDEQEDSNNFIYFYNPANQSSFFRRTKFNRFKFKPISD